MTRRRARGSSASHLQGINYLAIDHNLPRCWVVGNIKLRLMPDNVSGVMTTIFKEDIHMDGVNWKAVPGDHKKKYFEKFKKFFSWAPASGPAVFTAFMTQAAIRYKDMMCTFKKMPHKIPENVSQEIREKWLAYWSRPEVIAKSEKARRNRNSEVAGPGTGSSRHCGGSRSAYAHALALEKEKGHSPDAYDCMLLMHKRKDGTFMDERARIIAAAVEEAARAAREAAGDDAVDMTQIYCQVVPVVKQRLYGTGSRIDAFVHLDPTARPAQIDEETLRREIRQELQQQFTQQMAEQDARLREQLDAQRREMEQQMEALRTEILGEMHRQGLHPPPRPDA